MKQHLYARKTEEIIGHALKELGLDYAFLKSRAGLPHSAAQHLKSKHLSASQWFLICSLLHIPTDSISCGYSHNSHKARLRCAWERGLLDLPLTLSVRRFIREIRQDKKADRRFQRTCYSRGLRFRIFYRTLGPNLVKVCAREYNQTVLQLQRRLGVAATWPPLILADPISAPIQPKVRVRKWRFTVTHLPTKAHA